MANITYDPALAGEHEPQSVEWLRTALGPAIGLLVALLITFGISAARDINRAAEQPAIDTVVVRTVPAPSKDALWQPPTHKLTGMFRSR